MDSLLDLDAWRQVLQNSLTALGTSIGTFVPRLLGTILILLLGWLTASILALLARKALHRVGLDRLAEKVRLSSGLQRAGISLAPSVVVSRLVFWFLILVFAITAVDSLGLTAVTSTIDRFVDYIPNVLAAGLVVLFGLLLARLVRNVVTSAGLAANVQQAHRLGGLAHGVITVIVAVLAVEELGVDTHILVAVITGVVSAAALSMGLAFAIGARPLVTHILAGHFLRQQLVPGGSIEVGGRRGQVERVGALDTLLRSDEQAWSIPNSILLDSVKER